MTSLSIQPSAHGSAAGPGWSTGFRDFCSLLYNFCESRQRIIMILVLAPVLLGFYDNNPVLGNSLVIERQQPVFD